MSGGLPVSGHTSMNMVAAAFLAFGAGGNLLLAALCHRRLLNDESRDGVSCSGA